MNSKAIAKTSRNRLIRVISLSKGIEYAERQAVLAAEQAYAARRMDRVRACAGFLADMPPLTGGYAGWFYAGLADLEEGNLDGASLLLHSALSSPNAHLRDRARLYLGAVAWERKDYSACARIAEGVLRAGTSPYASLAAIRSLAVVRAASGDHRRALALLEGAAGIVKGIPRSRLFYEYHVSLATELLSAGRIAEARAFMSVAMSDPYASLCPDYVNTWHSIQQATAPRAKSYAIIRKPGRLIDGRARFDARRQREREKRKADLDVWTIRELVEASLGVSEDVNIYTRHRTRAERQ